MAEIRHTARASGRPAMITITDNPSLRTENHSGRDIRGCDRVLEITIKVLPSALEPKITTLPVVQPGYSEINVTVATKYTKFAVEPLRVQGAKK
jgi:hypothetical protein